MDNQHRVMIFFDWDGTLADSMELTAEEVKWAMERLHLPIPPYSERIKCNGPTMEASVAMLGIDPTLGEEYVELRKEACTALVPTHQKLFPGIVPMLQRLAKRAELAVLSNGCESYLKASLERFEIGDCFQYVFPYEEHRTKAQRLTDIMATLQPTYAMMVGDRDGDVQTGVVNGVTTIAAGYGYGEEWEYEGATSVANSTEELEAQISAWLDHI